MSDHIDEMAPVELDNMIKNGVEVHVIDVREDDEVASGTIPNAEHIRLASLPEKYIVLDKDKEYVIVCRSGRRGHTASEFLHGLGFKVKNLTGGMLKWPGDIQV